MTDFDLEKKLRAARVPTRDEDYWESFPRLVSAKLRATPAKRPMPERHWLPRLAWTGGVALACLIIGFAIGQRHGRTDQTDPDLLLQNARMLHEVMTMFPDRVRAIVQDQQGLQLVLSDQPDVLRSSPLWVKICDGKKCAAAVTFSGQEIQVAGRKLTVLADAQGDVILVGNDFAWSSDQPAGAVRGLKIEVKTLGSATL